MSRAAVVSSLQIVLIVLGGPLLTGWMRKVRSWVEGRSGPPVHQLLLDIAKHLRKQRTRPFHASWVYSAAPLVLVASALVVTALVPLVSASTAAAGSTDLFAVVFLLLLGSVFLALGALDSSSAFGGMGSSRGMVIGALAEPALLVTILALSVPVHSSNLGSIVSAALRHPIWLASPERLLALGAFLVVLLAETGRLPIDNPTTHLELTMVHEAMVLEYSGGDFALIKVGESMRLALLLGLLANLFIPWGIATVLSLPALAIATVVVAAKVAGLGAAIAAFEVFIAKVRLFRVPELMAGAFVLSVLAVVTSVVTR